MTASSHKNCCLLVDSDWNNARLIRTIVTNSSNNVNADVLTLSLPQYSLQLCDCLLSQTKACPVTNNFHSFIHSYIFQPSNTSFTLSKERQESHIANSCHIVTHVLTSPTHCFIRTPIIHYLLYPASIPPFDHLSVLYQPFTPSLSYWFNNSPTTLPFLTSNSILLLHPTSMFPQFSTF